MKPNELKKGKEPCKFTYEIKVGGDWKPVGRITYNMWEKENRRKKSTHNPEWIND